MEDFFRDLRALRVQAGLSIDELAERAHFPADSIAAAETGPEVPPNPVVVAFARACGAPVSEWEDRWRAATRATKNAPAVDGRETGPQSNTETQAEAATTALVAAAGSGAAQPTTTTPVLATIAATATRAAVPAEAAAHGSGHRHTGRRSRLSRRLAVGIAAGALLVGGSVAVLARPAAHIPPSAARSRTPKPRLRPAPAPSSAPRVAAWPEVAGVGCPHTSRAAVTLDAATQGPAWQGAGGGWAGNGCDGSSVWTMNPNGREPRPSAMSWSFSRRGRVSTCTLSVFVPAQNSLGQADYTIYEGSASLGTVTIDQATVAGYWVTLGTFPASGPAVEITLMPVVPSLTALDYGPGPGRPPHGHNTAVAASAAAMTCT